jgi:acyl carrier protein
MDVEQTVYTQIYAVAQMQGKTLAPLTADLPILESGLDSLCIAVLVANLEDQLGLDPFGSGDDVEMPSTIGDFVRIYEHAAATA